ncbi:OpgC domain-containing protein [Methylomonas sp. LL1]|uniref:OpgC family protein n=1 Tax=Methylomonas sp. LL1 TaxID=2785785 RepID=UPI0018C3D320|nr:OpgC domain-containing protein [Methylomonas sp. LL1]QPK64953.1 OpgC domain-containing protein [Methylomonas sp. LL1]
MKFEIRAAPPRNLQLDFFRGLALMIIFINHMPGNPWFAYTPSRLGPSDAAETFVFLSGFAAAIAYGRSFNQAGIGLGSVRVLFRCGQIYVAHLALFILMTSLFLWMNSQGIIGAHWQLDNLHYFFDQTQEAVLALVSLKYVPNFIDILPMYLVIMLWLPMAWVLSRIHVWLPLGFSLLLYLAAHRLGWELSADPTSSRSWYFNPFCWQLVFFTGFAFSSGWLPIPRFHQGLLWLCLLFVAFCYPLENPFGYQRLPWFAALRESWAGLLDKSHLGFIRYLHFLAMTYLVSHFMHRHPHWLQTGPAREIIAMGRQSLPIFMLGTCLSFAGGMLLDGTHPDLVESALINLAGLGLMLLCAQLLNWLDQKPWKTLGETPADNMANNWPAQSVLALGLLLLTAAPMLFLQSQQPPAAAMAEAEPDLVVSPENPTQITEEVVYQPNDEAIEMPDTL